MELIKLIRKYISPINAKMKESMRKILRKGLRSGFESGVMAQFGDSISYSQALLGSWCSARDIFGKTPDGHDYSPILEWMSGRNNALQAGKRPEYGYYSGWTARSVRQSVDTAIKNLKPTWAHLLIGCNDAYPVYLNMTGKEPNNTSMKMYRDDMRRIVERCTGLGVIPVLSTCNPMATAPEEAVLLFNEFIISTAAEPEKNSRQ